MRKIVNDSQQPEEEPKNNPEPEATNGDGEQHDPTGNESTVQEHEAPKVRRKIHVTTLSERYRATEWMIEHVRENGEKHIATKCIKQFPALFPGSSVANITKAMRWWKDRENTMGLKITGKRKGNFCFSTVRRNKRMRLKAIGGRGRKRAVWVSDLYNDLRDEFERLRSVGVKFNTSLLLQHAKKLISEANVECSYHRSNVINDKPILEHISIRWIQNFMSSNNIVLRAQSGKLSVSPKKQLQIDRTIAFHLGFLKRAFESGELNEDTVENADETHFVFNLDNGKTLAFIGDREVRYADVVSGGQPITMMVRITGGKHATICPPMIVFQNMKRSYPIRGLEDNIPGVCYRSSPKGWMDGVTWEKWLGERRAINRLSDGKKRVLFVDNCSSHTEHESVQEKLSNINTALRKLPPQTTNRTQPADSFVISKIKAAWRRRWDDYKYQQIENGNWKDGSGFIHNPGKLFFLKLAADSVRDVNLQTDEKGVNYARKAMIQCGMALNLDGRWSESQLTQELQEIISKHRPYFNGQPVDPADVETESDSE